MSHDRPAIGAFIVREGEWALAAIVGLMRAAGGEATRRSSRLTAALSATYAPATTE
jgi:hypothetical protein